MKGGNVNDFINTLSLGMELEFTYNGQTFLIEGDSDETGWSAGLVRLDPPAEDYIWFAKGPTMLDLTEKFLKAEIFDDKNFWQVEKDIEWIDG